MAQKMYFLALDNHLPSSYYGLWVTDGATTVEIGGIGNAGVAGSGGKGLEPSYLTPFGQKMIFSGVDSSGLGNSNIWTTDGTAGGTVEVGGTTLNKSSSPFPNGYAGDLNPQSFVTFADGTKALFFGANASLNTTLWVTDASVSGTKEVGGFGNAQVPGRNANWNTSQFTAFNNSVIFNANDTDGYNGLWITDGNTTTEIGGIDNAGVFNSPDFGGLSAHNFTQLGALMLFTASNAQGQSGTLWVTDGTALGTHEIGGPGNGLISGAANNAGLGGGLGEAVRFGNRVFFQGHDDSGTAGLWVTDGSASGTYEVGGAGNGGVLGAGLNGLTPSHFAVNGGKVLFNGIDHDGYHALWATDGTAAGTYEIGGGAVAVSGQSTLGLDPNSIVSLDNGKAVFVGSDSSNGAGTNRPTLWVTDNLTTTEIGGLNNQSVGGVASTGFSVGSSQFLGGDGFGYFVGQNTASNFVLWQTDGTAGGTKVVTAPGQPATGLHPASMAMAAPPQAESLISGGGKTIDLSTLPDQELTLFGSTAVEDTVNGSFGSLILASAFVALHGAGLLIRASGSKADVYDTNGTRDTISSKGAGGNTITLHGAQVTVVGSGNTISFAPGTTGNYVYIRDTNGVPDDVNGSNGTIALENAQANVNGGGDTILFVAGTTNVAALSNTAGAWDNVSAQNGATGTIKLSGALAQVTGGGVATMFNGGSGNVVQLVNSGGWSSVGVANGAAGTVLLTNALAQVTGGGVTAKFWGGAGNTVQFLNSGGAWNFVSAAAGSSGTVLLTSALAQVSGGGQSVKFWGGSGNAAQLLNTAGLWDNVSAAAGSSGTVYLSNAWSQVSGGGDTVNYWGGTDNRAQLINTGGVWDIVNAAAGSKGTTYLTSAQAQINGGGQNAYFWGGSGNLLHLANTGTSWDTVGAAASSTGTVFLTSAWAQVNGGGDNIQFLGGTNNAVHLANTGGVWDGVSASAGVTGTIHLTSAQTQITGGGFTVNFLGGVGNQVSLVNTGATPTTFNNVGSVTGMVYLSNARAVINGSGDTVNFFAGTNNAATVSGSNEAFVFASAAFGLDTITGFNASDTLSFSVANQGQLAVSQASGNTLITLNAGNVVTLAGYTGAVSLSYHS